MQEHASQFSASTLKHFDERDKVAHLFLHCLGVVRLARSSLAIMPSFYLGRARHRNFFSHIYTEGCQSTHWFEHWPHRLATNMSGLPGLPPRKQTRKDSGQSNPGKFKRNNNPWGARGRLKCSKCRERKQRVFPPIYLAWLSTKCLFPVGESQCV